MTAEEYILQIPIMTRQKNSLSQVRQFLDHLGNPDRKLSIIHVAGTNGKGSVCAYLTCALREAGYLVGTFVSPHLEELRERFLLNGYPIEREDLESVFTQVKDAADVLTKKGLNHPAFFEFLFYMAVQLFSQKKVDFWVMETGLGGRLDTTNVVEHPLVSVITSISLDHTQYLGNTIEEIAGEKAGIIKPGIPVVYDANFPQAAKVIDKKAKQINSPAYPIARRDFSASGLSIPFSAPYQQDNGILAWKVLQVLMHTCAVERSREMLLRRGMEKMVWPGRMEEIQPGIFLDGAHNPGGIQAFAEAAEKIPARRRLLLFGVSSDKAYKEMVSVLCRRLKPAITAAVHFQNKRSLGEEAAAACFEREHCPVKRFAGAKEALEFLLAQKEEKDVVFCAGSLYLIGELRALCRRSADKQIMEYGVQRLSVEWRKF